MVADLSLQVLGLIGFPMMPGWSLFLKIVGTCGTNTSRLRAETGVDIVSQVCPFTFHLRLIPKTSAFRVFCSLAGLLLLLEWSRLRLSLAPFISPI